MTLRPIWFVIPLLPLVIEGSIHAWRHFCLTTSTAPVFHWNETPLVSNALPPFGAALERYRADGGAEYVKLLPNGRQMTFFYFEWASIFLGPFADVSGHEVEVCNVTYGSFKLLESGGKRSYTFSNGERIIFNYTLLADKNGKPVHMYKAPWIQGFGEWESTDSSRDRFLRLRRSFILYRGAARVLEAGFFGAESENEAWRLFQREVLDKLEWR